MGSAWATNELSPQQLYKLRRVYDTFYNSTNPEYLNTWDKRYYYGRVDADFNSILVRSSKLKSIRQTKDIKALNFVVDAFEGLRRYMRRAATRPGVNIGEGHFLHKLSAKTGWVDPKEIYAEFIKNYNVLFLGTYIDKHNLAPKIDSIDTYIKYFMEFYLNTDFITPLSRSVFTLSKLIPFESSGLCVSIATDDPADDQIKVEKYYNSPHFDLYLNAARKFGFLIDKNAPWRLIANIGSPNMTKYMENNCINTSSLFKTCYVKNYHYDIDTLRNYMILYYNSYARANPVTEWKEYQQCEHRIKSIVRTVRRRPLEIRQETMGQLGSRHDRLGDNYWYSQYYLIRSHEAFLPVDTDKFQRESKKIIQLKKYVDKEEALKYINDKTKTTYRRLTMPPGPHTPIENLIRNAQDAATPLTETVCGDAQLTPAAASETGPVQMASTSGGASGNSY